MDPVPQHEFATSITDMVFEAGALPQAMVDAIEASAQRALTGLEWLALFQNAALIGPPINVNLVEPETAGLFRVDNSHNVDQNEWMPQPHLRSIRGRVTTGAHVFNTRKAVGLHHYDFEDDEIIHDHWFNGPMYTLKRLTVRKSRVNQGGIVLDQAIAFAHYYWEERYEGLEEEEHPEPNAGGRGGGRGGRGGGRGGAQ